MTQRGSCGLFVCKWTVFATATILCLPLVAADERPGFRETGLLVYDAAVNQQSVRCIVDTGSSTSTIDTTVCRVDGGTSAKPEMSQTATGILIAPVIENIEVAFNGSHSVTINPTAVDLTIVGRYNGQQIGAIIGRDILKDYVISIHRGQPLVVTAASESATEHSVTVPFANKTGPVLPVQLPVLGSRSFLVDTGYNGNLIVAENLAAALIRSQRAIAGPEHPGVDLIGMHAVKKIIVRQIDVSGVVFENVSASVGKVSVVGMGIISRLEICIDFPQLQVSIQPEASAPSGEFPFNCSGMFVVFTSRDQLRVEAVRDGSPAFAAGIHVGDEVLQIDDRFPSDFSRAGLDSVLAQNNRSIHLKLRRKSRTYSVDLLLKQLYEYPPKWPLDIDSDTGFFDSLKEKD